MSKGTEELQSTIPVFTLGGPASKPRLTTTQSTDNYYHECRLVGASQAGQGDEYGKMRFAV